MKFSSQTFLNGIVQSYLAPAWLGLALVQFGLAGFHFYSGELFLARWIAPLELLLAFVLLGARYRVRTGRILPDQAHSAVALTAVLMFGLDILTLNVHHDPLATIEMIFVVIGLGAFFLSWAWFWALASFASISWGLSVWHLASIGVGTLDSWSRLSADFSIAVVLSLLIHLARLQVFNELAANREKMLNSAKLSALGEMAGGISHEINNPLTSLMLRAEVLGRGLPDKDLVEPILKDARRINAIVKGLLAFSREADHDRFEAISVRELVDNSVALCVEKFKHHGILLRVESIPQELKIDCRATQISQILLNLLSNAFDAVKGSSEKCVVISVLDCGDFIEIRVMDSGPGVADEIRDRIMDPFFTTKGPQSGTGLGLSISKGLAESHRGTLVLAQSSGMTQFLLKLQKKLT